uniref:Uncharacterized protein n=1 Tax=Mycena chlorophos TaxID=658473 RepID=A0ABQ0LB56_MYCCL|nr:predicted protein [Mycena chlorophos]
MHLPGDISLATPSLEALNTTYTSRQKYTLPKVSLVAAIALAPPPPPPHSPAYILVPSSTGRIHPPPRSPVINKAHTSTSIWCVRARSEPSMGRRNGPGRERAHEIRIVQEGERVRKWLSARVAGSGAGSGGG